MGTALTEDQLRLLKRFTRKIVLALDPDAAGQKAILRGLDAVRQAMDREGELRFDARGLLRNEARLQADLRVASLPDGLDPDEIVARDPEEWARLIEEARPIVTHVMETLAEGQDLNDPKVKSNIAAQMVPLIEDLPNPIERETYRQQLARFLRVDERALIGAQAQVRARSGSKYPRQKRSGQRPDADRQPVDIKAVNTVSPSFKLETNCLSVLLQKPELLHHLDRRLQESNLQRLSTKDFEYTDYQVLFELICQSIEQDGVDHHQFVVMHLPDGLLETVAEALKQTEKLDPIEEKVIDELFRGVVNMRRIIAEKNINQLRFMMEEEQQSGDLLVRTYQKAVQEQLRFRDHLDQALKTKNFRRIG